MLKFLHGSGSRKYFRRRLTGAEMTGKPKPMFPRPVAAIVPICVFSFTAPAVFADGPFYGDPPDATHPWALHDMNRPQPPIVTPGTFSTPEQPGRPPSDARVLFDGTPATLDKWEADKNPPEPTKWVVKDGTLQCVPGSGYIRTKEEFGDCQLHVEWSAPLKVEGQSQGRGNSGVFLMGQTEVQVLDNYENPTYSDGTAGSVYGASPANGRSMISFSAAPSSRMVKCSIAAATP